MTYLLKQCNQELDEEKFDEAKAIFLEIEALYDFIKPAAETIRLKKDEIGVLIGETKLHIQKMVKSFLKEGQDKNEQGKSESVSNEEEVFNSAQSALLKARALFNLFFESDRDLDSSISAAEQQNVEFGLECAMRKDMLEISEISSKQQQRGSIEEALSQIIKAVNQDAKITKRRGMEVKLLAYRLMKCTTLEQDTKQKLQEFKDLVKEFERTDKGLANKMRSFLNKVVEYIRNKMPGSNAKSQHALFTLKPKPTDASKAIKEFGEKTDEKHRPK